MRIKLRSRTDPVGRSRGCTQLDRHTQAYRDYLTERGNATGYLRNCEAAVVHLSMWMKQARQQLTDVDEELVAEFLEHHLPGCRCATSALGSSNLAIDSVRAISSRAKSTPMETDSRT